MPRCQSQTLKGRQCTRRALSGSQFCQQHHKYKMTKSQKAGGKQKAEEQSTLDKDLIKASKEGRLDTVQQLLKEGANIEFKDPEDHTALINAIDKEHWDVVKELLENGANVHVEYELPIRMAVEKKNHKWVKELIE